MWYPISLFSRIYCKLHICALMGQKSVCFSWIFILNLWLNRSTVGTVTVTPHGLVTVVPLAHQVNNASVIQSSVPQYPTIDSWVLYVITIEFPLLCYAHHWRSRWWEAAVLLAVGCYPTAVLRVCTKWPFNTLSLSLVIFTDLWIQ